MSNAIEHFSRHRVGDTTLQVMADTQRNLSGLIEEEQSVIRHYTRLGVWPHKRVNMFIFEDLQPLVAQIKSATALPSVVADDIDQRPMVNIYDSSDLAECAVFVNRRVLKQDGVCRDQVALRALLAHEHGHPLSENATVRAARDLTVEIKVEDRASGTAIGRILQLLAHRLCLYAPQEVFANEIAIRAGFGDALFHLDRGAVEKACLGVSKRQILAESLGKQAGQGKLSADQAAALLLVGDLQAHLVFALETAPFLRAGDRDHAQALEVALADGVWGHLDPAAMRLYEKLRDHYLRLRVDFAPAEMKAWAGEALVFLSDAVREKNLRIRFHLVRAQRRREPSVQPRPKPP
jgi:hypothetical protein